MFRCFPNKYRRWTVEDMMDAYSDALYRSWPTFALQCLCLSNCDLITLQYNSFLHPTLIRNVSSCRFRCEFTKLIQPKAFYKHIEGSLSWKSCAFDLDFSVRSGICGHRYVVWLKAFCKILTLHKWISRDNLEKYASCSNEVSQYIWYIERPSVVHFLS